MLPAAAGQKLLWENRYWQNNVFCTLAAMIQIHHSSAGDVARPAACFCLETHQAKLIPAMQRSRSRTPRDLKHFDADAGHPSLSGSENYAWHFDMLHDDARLEAFCSAFDRLPSEVVKNRALDIGCGSGILGLALLQRCPDIPEVIAYERDPTLAEVARRNAVKNGLNAKFTVHAVPSTDMSLAGAKRAKLVVAEILDAALLGEDCLVTLRHAARCLLQDQYFAIPAAADVWACAVESEVLASFQSVESAWWAPEVYRRDDGDANPHDVVLEKLVAAGQARVLTQDFPALFFDFEHLPAISGSKLLEVKLEASGRLDAIVFWWQCYMLRGDHRGSMTNAPWTKNATPRREIGHWRQAVCVLPQRRFLEAGETLSLMAFHTDEDIWFRIVEVPDPGRDSWISLPRGCSTLSLMSPQRLWMLSNRQKYQQIQDAMDLAVRSLKSLHPQGAIQVGGNGWKRRIFLDWESKFGSFNAGLDIWFFLLISHPQFVESLLVGVLNLSCHLISYHILIFWCISKTDLDLPQSPEVLFQAPGVRSLRWAHHGPPLPQRLPALRRRPPPEAFAAAGRAGAEDHLLGIQQGGSEGWERCAETLAEGISETFRTQAASCFRLSQPGKEDHLHGFW